MEYKQLSSLVPQGEHFDESAIGEGVWLSLGHIRSIEVELASIDVLKQRVQDSATTITTLKDANTSQDNTIAERDTALANLQVEVDEKQSQIDALQAQVDELGAKSSGGGTNITTMVDNEPGTASTGKPSWFKEDGSTALAEKYSKNR